MRTFAIAAALALFSASAPAQGYWQLDATTSDFAVTGNTLVAALSDTNQGPRLQRGDIAAPVFNLVSGNLQLPPGATYSGAPVLLSPNGLVAATTVSTALAATTCVRWSGYSISGTAAAFQASVANALVEVYPGFEAKSVALDGTLTGEEALGALRVPGQIAPNGVFSYLRTSQSFAIVAGASDDGSTVAVNEVGRADVWHRNGPDSPLLIQPGAIATSARAISGDGSTVVGFETSNILGSPNSLYALWRNGVAERIRNTPLVGEFASGNLLVAFNDGTAIGQGNLNGSTQVTLVQPDIFSNIPLPLAWPLAGFPSPQLPTLTSALRGRDFGGSRYVLVEASINSYLLQIPNGTPLPQPRLGLADYLFPGIPNQFELTGGTPGAPFILLLGSVDTGGAFGSVLQFGQNFNASGNWSLGFAPPPALSGLKLAIGAIGFNPSTGLFAIERAVEFP